MFAKRVEELLRTYSLLLCDFELLKRTLVENPKSGSVIPGTGGLRKIRLKSPGKGKSGGLRVCYLDDQASEMLFLIIIYAKNEQEDLTPAEKKALRELVYDIKGKKHE